MKAAYVAEQGSLDGLKYGERPDPSPGPADVLIRVKACSLNRVDLFAVLGKKGVRLQIPRILGRDFAGEVAEVGPQVEGRFHTGDRVVIRPQVSCMRCEYCLRGRDNECSSSWTLGLSADGGLAEYAVVPAINVYPMPDTLSFNEAASMPTTYLTAWHMLICRAGLRPGEDVLVQAAGSGVGSAAIQIARVVGARVITTAGSDEKLERARALGAHATINYRSEDFLQRVLELTDGQGVDVVFDHIGASIWEKNFACLKRGGRFVNCGVSAGHRVELHMGQLFTRQLSVLGSSGGSHADMLDILRLAALGELRGVVARTFPLSEARAAFETMAASDFFGKIVLRP